LSDVELSSAVEVTK